MQIGVLAKEGSQRTHPRLQLPAAVWIGGRRYDALDWSLGGFGLGDGELRGAAGDLVGVRLVLRFPIVEATLELTAKVVRVVRGHAVGFRFVDLPADKAALLRFVAETYLAGDLVAPRALAAAGLDGGMLRAPPRLAQALRGGATVLRYGLALALTLAGLSAAGLAVLASFLTIRAEHAAVAADVVAVRAPVAGFLMAVAAPGTRLAAGERVAVLGGDLAPAMLAARQAELDHFARLVAFDEDRLAETRRAVGAFAVQAAAEVGLARQQRDLSAEAATLQRRHVERGEALLDMAIVSRSQAEAERALLLGREVALREAELRLARAGNKLAAARDGQFWADGHGTAENPGVIERRLREIRSLAALKQAELAATALRRDLPSPCACVVAVTPAQAGEFVGPGTTVVRLAAAPQHGTEIDALVPRDKLRFLRQGQPATVLLALDGSERAATVIRLGHDPAQRERLGLPATGLDIGRMGVVTLRLDEAVAAEPGLPVIATFRLSFAALFRHLTGAAWPWPSG